MKADLTSLTLKSSGFAEIVAMYPDERFPKNGKNLYLLHPDGKVNPDIASRINSVVSKINPTYSVCELQDSELPLADGTTLHTQIENGYGILLPIASLDRIESL